MQIKLLALGTALCSVLFFSCKKNKKNEDCNTISSNSNYLPLKDGNYWVYSQNTIDTLGNVVSIAQKNDTIKVIKDTTIAGIVYKKINITNNNAPFSFPKFMRKTKSGVVFPVLNSNTNSFQGEENIYFSSIKDTLISIECINTSWAPNCEYERGKISINNIETITVGAGSFNVTNNPEVIIKNNGMWPFWGIKRTNDYQFSNNIGLIRSETFFISSTNYIVSELTSYHLN